MSYTNAKQPYSQGVITDAVFIRSFERTIDDGEDQAPESEQRRAQGAEEVELLCKQKHRHAQPIVPTTCCNNSTMIVRLQGCCRQYAKHQMMSHH